MSHPGIHVIGNIVKGEYVDINSVFPKISGFFAFQIQGMPLHYLSERQGAVRLGIPVLKIVVLSQSLGGNPAELFILLPEHSKIQIIIPRNESLMPDGADQGAAAQEIPDSVFLADPSDLFGNFQLHQLYLSQQFTLHGVSPSFAVCPTAEVPSPPMPWWGKARKRSPPSDSGC